MGAGSGTGRGGLAQESETVMAARSGYPTSRDPVLQPKLVGVVLLVEVGFGILGVSVGEGRVLVGARTVSVR